MGGGGGGGGGGGAAIRGAYTKRLVVTIGKIYIHNYFSHICNRRHKKECFLVLLFNTYTWPDESAMGMVRWCARGSQPTRGFC